MVPYARVPNAGGRHVLRLYRALERQGAELTVLSHDYPSSRDAREEIGRPENLVLIGDEKPSAWGGALHWGASLARRLSGRFAQYLPDPRLTAELICAKSMREPLRRADVVDLQWQTVTYQAPVVRLLAPRARVVGTLHDVDSQKWGRRAGRARGARRQAMRAIAAACRLAERGLGRVLDQIVVLNEKDADLLRANGVAEAKVVVMNPLIDMEAALRARDPDGRTVLFVSYLGRAENEEALLWFVAEIWPRIQQAIPTAQLHVVGKDATVAAKAAVGLATNARLLGFVDDLDAEYAGASVAVVPLLMGAGIKFKALEAVLAGVPTVVTSIGAEGIGGADVFAAVCDDARGFAEAVIGVLQDPSAEARASQVARKLAPEYSPAAFDDVVRAVYATREINAR